MELSAKNHLRLHRYVGIASLLLIFLRPILLFFPFAIETDPITFSTYIGRIGAVLGAAAFLTGGGLGKYLSEEKSRIAEIHTILMLGGLVLQVPILSEIRNSLFLNLISLIGCLLLVAGWVLGRRVFRNRKRILPF